MQRRDLPPRRPQFRVRISSRPRQRSGSFAVCPPRADHQLLRKQRPAGSTLCSKLGECTLRRCARDFGFAFHQRSLREQEVPLSEVDREPGAFDIVDPPNE